MLRRLLAGALLATLLYGAEAPAPAEYLKFEPGEDFKLADYAQITGYFRELDEASDRLTLVEFGKSANGKAMYAAFISSAENLRNLDRYREINRRMALGEPDAEEARRLAREGKAIVWIDSGLHATEVAPVQHAPVLAHRMVTGETEEIRRIRDNVILMQVPVLNPDGLDWVVHWYRRNVGTPYELAPLPHLYQKYAGHDNNRDWFMLNLRETRHAARLLFREWFPHIVYNQHQQPAFPARIFVPPYAEPLNPNVPAAVMEGIGMIGAAMKERFARENKPGVLSYHGFDAWWNGGLRTAPPFHNMHGILTETAAGVLATPRVDERDELPESFSSGMPAQLPSVFYQRPWLGGRWGVKNAIEYMLTADFAILDLASSRPDHFIQKAYDLARLSIDQGAKGGPYAYVVPEEQWDSSSALEMLRRLQWAGIRVHRARSAFDAGDKEYPAGSYVLLASQPFRPYLIDLMEPQKYPKIRQGKNGPTKRPYDVSGWTLRMSMGVAVDRVEKPFEADLREIEEVPAPAESLNHRDNASFVTTAKLLERGEKVRWGDDGEILVGGKAPRNLFDAARYELRKPRLALYEPWTANMDTGWTQLVLDNHKVPYTLVHDNDVRAGGLNRSFDSIVLASQQLPSILHGFRSGEASRRRKPELDAKAEQRPEYTGGIGIAGLSALEEFVRNGGTLIALDAAADLPMRMFPLAVRDILRDDAAEEEKYYCPGSLLYANIDTSHPVAFGMPAETAVFSRKGKAFDVTLLERNNNGGRRVRTIASYAKADLLASGWISGEKAVLGKPIAVDVRHGKGRVILFGFRPQFRGWTHGTFKLLLNAVYLASAKEL